MSQDRNIPLGDRKYSAPDDAVPAQRMLVLKALPTLRERLIKLAIIFTVVAGIGYLAYRHFTDEKPQQQAATAIQDDENRFRPGTIDPNAIRTENDIQTVARAAGAPPSSTLPTTPSTTTAQAPTPATLNNNIPPPPPDNTVAVEKKNDTGGIIGDAMGLGPIEVSVENYWVDDDKKTVAYAILSGSLKNNSNQQMTLPQLEVLLLDSEKRSYKPSKQTISHTGPLNPLISTKAVWFFELPPATPMYCAQFSFKQGKNAFVTYVRLAERTADNLKMMEDQDYQAAFVELMLQASPRVKAQEAYYKAKTMLDAIGEQVDDLQLQIAKLEKKLKTATDAAENAKAGLDKAKKDSESVKAWMKDIESSPAKFGHNQRLQEIEMGKAQAQAQRVAKSEVSAEQTLKEKLAAKSKIDTEMKDLLQKLKQLATKYETQEKATDKLKEKFE